MPMQELVEYVQAHTDRTACKCGQCLTNGPDQLPGSDSRWAVGAFRHTADMVFFEVSAKDNPDAEELRRLILDNQRGAWDDLNPLDGQEHSYIQVGAWIGDQGLAMQLMGLGAILGLWPLMTPKMIGVDGDLAMQMAGAGYVSIVPGPAR